MPDDTIPAVQFRNGAPWHRVRPDATGLTACGLDLVVIEPTATTDWRDVNDLHRCGRCGPRTRARRL